MSNAHRVTAFVLGLALLGLFATLGYSALATTHTSAIVVIGLSSVGAIAGSAAVAMWPRKHRERRLFLLRWRLVAAGVSGALLGAGMAILLAPPFGPPDTTQALALGAQYGACLAGALSFLSDAVRGPTVRVPEDASA